jgi:cytidine deaminase
MKDETILSNEQRQILITAAQDARQWAYAPYSQFPVGAALLTASGRIYDGVNVENAAYPSGICAERVAIFKAVSQGERDFLAIAVVTPRGGSPCGACRQVMAEFGLDLQVLIADEHGNCLHSITLRQLLPEAFGPHNLNLPR